MHNHCREHALTCHDGENCIVFKSCPVSGPSVGLEWAELLIRNLINRLCEKNVTDSEAEVSDGEDKDN